MSKMRQIPADEIARAIAVTSSDQGWSPIDAMVQRVAESGAGRPLDNVYEYTAFDDGWRDDLNSGDVARVRGVLKHVYESFRDDWRLKK